MVKSAATPKAKKDDSLKANATKVKKEAAPKVVKPKKGKYHIPHSHILSAVFIIIAASSCAIIIIIHPSILPIPLCSLPHFHPYIPTAPLAFSFPSKRASSSCDP